MKATKVVGTYREDGSFKMISAVGHNADSDENEWSTISNVLRLMAIDRRSDKQQEFDYEFPVTF